MEDSMILRVSLAIAECSMDGPFEDWSERMARAAIEEMRRPTQSMLDAAGLATGFEDTAALIYRVMLDDAAGLPPPSRPERPLIGPALSEPPADFGLIEHI